ncbi:elongation factor Ts [Candidatus Dojkabacteria bacterium]|uniref:Elongation factor Ts n=1 Tax=Candidatus Dojkabacteria bacterium TaxID=2099670 RepID=A0A847VDX5_9BACT|nr:elongation factor Ts [Candidatus Dojkabacteria bacterium]
MSTIEDIKILRAKTSAGMALCKEALEKSNGDMEKAIGYINSRSDVISRLHSMTRAKIGHCKLAFEEAGNNFEKAVALIRERGWDDPIERECESNLQGIIDTYIHGQDRKLVSMVEVICKTDFVARNDDFRSFVHELVLQIAAMKPVYISREDIPKEKLDEITELFQKEVESEGKPADMSQKIVEGKLNKFFQEKCLLEQKWFKDESKTIKNLLEENTTKLGEPLEIRRFLIWELGK